MIQFHPDICHQQMYLKIASRRNGNCFFRSVAVYVHGDEDYHMNVRKKLCTHITVNKDVYSTLLFNNSMACHLKNMAHGQLRLNYRLLPIFMGLIYMFWQKSPAKQIITGYVMQRLLTQVLKKTILKKFTHMQLAHCSSVHFDVIIDLKSKEVPTVRPVLCTNMLKYSSYTMYQYVMFDVS